MIDFKDVTIIIPHLGKTKEEEYALDQCLISLKESVPKIKVLVTKNGEKCSHDNFDVWVKEQDQGMAVNAAVAVTDTPWIFITNSDMIYALGWWEKLTSFLLGDQNERYDYPSCISPQLVEPQSGAPTFIKYFCGGAGGDFDKSKWLIYAKHHFEKVGGTLRTGFNLPFLIKRELWDLIGGYDVNYRPWGSNADSDLEYKIKLAGVQSYQNTSCIVYHFGQSSGTFSPDNRAYWQKNWDYFIQKWGFERASSPAIWQANFEIPWDKLKYRPKWEKIPITS